MPKKLKGTVKKVWESKIKQAPSKNTHISYSSLSTYNKCPKLWELMYLRNEVPFTQNIYTCFGTAMHETIQEWLTVMYHDSVKAANDINLDNSEEIEFAMTGLWYRLSDKINRWKNMIISGRRAQNETLIDTFQDVTNYGIIAQLVKRGLWKND